MLIVMCVFSFINVSQIFQGLGPLNPHLELFDGDFYEVTLDGNADENSAVDKHNETAAKSTTTSNQGRSENALSNESNPVEPAISPDKKAISKSSAASDKENSETSTNIETTSTAISSNSTAFQRYDGVVIVTKVLWPKDIGRLKRMLCYIAAAYNDKVKYDIVVFTTLPWTEEQIAELQGFVAPVKLTVALEGPPLEEQLAAMTKEEVDFLRKRCNATTEEEELTYFHHCTEEHSDQLTNLGYSWQAEFRAYHIWTHPALMDYKYMMWFDSDVRIGKEWDQDPMKVMVENDLAILFAGFPYGKSYNPRIKDKMDQVYGRSICNSFLVEDGTLNPHACEDDSKFTIQQIAGNHHITNLEVYRKDIHQEFLKKFVGDHRFSREADDQIAVTIPALIENNGKKAWHERSHGLHLLIHHHGMYDVVRSEKGLRNKHRFWEKTIETWPALKDRCKAYH